MNDSPSRVVSCVHDEPIFDQPSDDCAPVDMHVTAKKRDLWKNKKLHGCLYEKPAGDVRTLIRQLKKPEIKKIKRIDIRCSKCISVYVAIAKELTYKLHNYRITYNVAISLLDMVRLRICTCQSVCCSVPLRGCLCAIISSPHSQLLIYIYIYIYIYTSYSYLFTHYTCT